MIHVHSTPHATPSLPATRLVQTHQLVYTFSRVIAISFLFMLLFMLLAPWQQTSSGLGQVVAYNPLERRQVLSTPVKGRLSRWRVTEGSFVKKGQVIAEMSDIDPQALSRIQQQQEAIKEQLKLALRQATAYKNKIKALRKVRRMHLLANRLKVRMAQQKYRASRQKQKAIAASLRIAKINLRRKQKLFKDAIVSHRSVELSELKVTKLQMQLNAAKAARLAAHAQIIEARTQRLRKEAEDLSKMASADAEFQKAMDKAASARNKLAKIATKVARQISQVIRAPRDAVVLRLLANEGSEVLKAGDPIVILVPHTNAFAVELWLDGNDIPLLKKGRHVRLQFEGWPAIQFMGWPSVAVGTFGGRVALVDITNNKQGKFRIVVLPDPKEPAWPRIPFLRQGMKAKGWVLLDQVRVGYEIWRQLNGFPPTVQAPTKQEAGKSKSSKAKKQ